MASKPRIKMNPKTVAQGDVVEVQVLASHLMETGERQVDGVLVPRSILKKFSCEARDGEIFSADLTIAVSANPYMRFKFRPKGPPGPLRIRFIWTDEEGGKIVAEEQITVT